MTNQVKPLVIAFTEIYGIDTTQWTYKYTPEEFKAELESKGHTVLDTFDHKKAERSVRGKMHRLGKKGHNRSQIEKLLSQKDQMRLDYLIWMKSENITYADFYENN